jgi:hypothetical protein
MGELFKGLKGIPAGPIDQQLVEQIGAEPKQRGKLDSSAYAYWVGLGPTRSWVALGRAYGVSGSAAAKYGKRHRFEERLMRSQPSIIAETTAAVAMRVKEKTAALTNLDPSKDDERNRKVRDLLVETGLELLERAKRQLELVTLGEPKEVLAALRLSSDMLLKAVETSDERSGQTLVEMMKARLARLQVEPARDVEFTTKPAAPVKGLDDE